MPELLLAIAELSTWQDISMLLIYASSFNLHLTVEKTVLFCSGSSDRQGRDLTWKIREACKADWGDVCQLHCETFHPTSTWLGGAWLRSQRHKAFEVHIAQVS